MSIKALGQKIIEEAKDNIDDNLFDIQIGQKNIVISYLSGGRIELKRWYNDVENHHIYSAFSSLVWGSRTSEEMIKVITEGLKFAFEYMKVYADFKKVEGFLVVKERGHEYALDDSAANWIKGLDNTELTESEKEKAHLFFHAPVKDYLAGQLSEKLTRIIKIAHNNALSLEEVLRDNPLALASSEPVQIMKFAVDIKYHSEKIFFMPKYADEIVEVRLTNQDEKVILNMPLEVGKCQALLLKVQEENKMKNLINPDPIFFRKFIHSLGYVTETSIKNEFDKLNQYFDEWTEIEILFKEAFENDKKNDVKEAVNYTESRLEKSIICRQLELGNRTFWFVFENDLDNNDMFNLKVFVSELGSESLEANEHIQWYLSQTMKLNLQNLH